MKTPEFVFIAKLQLDLDTRNFVMALSIGVISEKASLKKGLLIKGLLRKSLLRKGLLRKGLLKNVLLKKGLPDKKSPYEKITFQNGQIKCILIRTSL